MPWFRIDDSFYDHPKVADLPDSAVALWVRAGAYCARHLTDGSVSRRTANRLCDASDEAIDALLKSGLWIEDGDTGFRFHDWHVYQPTAAEAKATRDARSVGGAIGNHERWHVSKGRSDPKCAYCRSSDRSSDRSGDQSPDRVTESGANRPRVPRPVPSRPVPVKSKSGSGDVVSSLTKQDPPEEEEPSTDGAYVDPERQWLSIVCPEHGAQNVTRCDRCKVEHGDLRYWTKRKPTPDLRYLPEAKR